MADNDFRVTMVDPNGGEFVAGSPEIVARLTAQGYRKKDEADAVADEREQAAANVPVPKGEEVGGLETGGNAPAESTADDSSKQAPIATPSPKPGAKPSSSK